MQNELILYAIERTLYRLSISPYSDHFIIKGGIYLYALFDQNYSRSTKDIDLLAENISNDLEFIQKVFIDIFSIECDDAIKFDLSSIKVKAITEFKQYHGINVIADAYLDKTTMQISIDIGFDDIIFPNKVLINYPVLLNMSNPSLYSYSIYSVIAEKFEATVSLGMLNSRYKDFYDIYCLSKKIDLDGKQLTEAVKLTFSHRKTSIEQIEAFTDDFIYSPVNINRWQSFIKSKHIFSYIPFEDTINQCKKLLIPIVDSILLSDEFNKVWIACDSRWT